MNATPAEIVAKALHDMPSPIADTEFEPGYWRSCVTWEQLIEKAAPAVITALLEHYHLLPKVEVKVWVENDAWVSDRGEEIVELFPADAEVWEVAEIEGQLAESLHEVRAVAAALASAADVAEVKP